MLSTRRKFKQSRDKRSFTLQPFYMNYCAVRKIFTPLEKEKNGFLSCMKLFQAFYLHGKHFFGRIVKIYLSACILRLSDSVRLYFLKFIDQMKAMRREEIVAKSSVNSVLDLRNKNNDRSFFTQFESAVKNLEILNVEEQISRNFFVQQFAVA